MLALLGMLGPFSIDTYIPAFAGIAQSTGATPVQMQQTLSAYLFGFAFMNLFHGALSDSFGRRPIVLWGLAAFALTSAGCALAQTPGQLILFRALQGCTTGAGIVVSRAVVRDLFPPAQAQRVMSQITIYFGIAPAVAPMIGGVFIAYASWQSIFWLLTVIGALLWAVSSERGSRWLWQTAVSTLGGKLSGEWRSGSFAHGFTVNDVHYLDGATRITVSRLESRWELRLRPLHFTVDKLHAGDVSLALNRLAIGQASRDGSKLGDLLLERGRRQIDRRARGLIEAGRRSGYLRFDDAEEAYRGFYGLIVSDLHVRMLLGEAPDKDFSARAKKAVVAFLTLYGTEKVHSELGGKVA